MVKVIVTDLDETLLHSDKYISEYTISVLQKYQAKGIKIIFATARSTQASARILEQFMPDVFVGYGGALALAGDKVIHRFDIPVDISNQLINECLQTPEITSILAVNESVAFTNNPLELESKDSSHYQYFDFAENNDQSYLKISLVTTDSEIVKRIAAHYPMCDMLRYTGEDLYRFANRDALKWNALKAISEHYNIGTDQFIAFGDDVNDLEMIEKCGIGIAVENGIDQLKQVADYICDTNNHDGVAKWLEAHIT